MVCQIGPSIITKRTLLVITISTYMSFGVGFGAIWHNHQFVIKHSNGKSSINISSYIYIYSYISTYVYSYLYYYIYIYILHIYILSIYLLKYIHPLIFPWKHVSLSGGDSRCRTLQRQCPGGSQHSVAWMNMENIRRFPKLEIVTRWCPPSYKLVYNPNNYRYNPHKP